MGDCNYKITFTFSNLELHACTAALQSQSAAKHAKLFGKNTPTTITKKT